MSIDSRLREGLQRSMSAIATDPDQHLEDAHRQGRKRLLRRRAFTATVIVAGLAVIALVGPAMLGALRDQGHEPMATPSSLPIVGNYVVRVTTTDATRAGAPGAAGTWVLKLHGDGVLELAPLRSGDPLGGPSQYQVSGDRFLTTALGSASCQGLGTYTWSRSDSTLTFIVVSDPCALRVAVFSSGPWRAT